MIDLNIVMGLAIVGVVYNLMFLYIVIRGVRKWKNLLEQKEQELKRCKMERKAILSRRI